MPGFRQPRTVVLCLTGLAGAAGMVAVFHPGFMSHDSLTQLAQGRSGLYTDQHPPSMSWLLGRFDALTAGHGPTCMLAFHNLLLWSALALLALELFEGWASLPWMLAVGLFPTVVATMDTVWKDVGMAASFLLAVALLVAAERRRSEALLWAAIVPLFYGWTVRQNAVTAALPLVLWWAWLFCCLHGVPGRRAVAGLACGCLAGFALGTAAIDGALTRGRERHNGQTIPLFDLQGISVLAHENLMPAWELAENPQLSLASMTRIYYPNSAALLLYGPERLVSQTSDPRKLRELYAAWLGAIMHHPADYLRHRWELAKALFGIGWNHVEYPFHPGVDPNDLGVFWHPSRVTLNVMAGLQELRDSLFFRGWFFFCLLLIELGLCQRRHASAAAWAIGASALLYGLSLIPTVPGDDFRYLFWTVLATLVLPLPLFSRRLAPASRSPTLPHPSGTGESTAPAT